MTSERLSSLALGRLKLETFTGFSERTELHLCDRLALCKKKKKKRTRTPLTYQLSEILFFFFAFVKRPRLQSLKDKVRKVVTLLDLAAEA